MSRRIKKKPTKSFFTAFLAFWTTLPGIVGGITGLIVAIGGLYAAIRPVFNVVNPNDNRASTSQTAAPTPALQAVTPTLAPLQSPAPGSSNPNSNVCNQYFSAIPNDRIKSIKLGVTDYPLIRVPKQSKDGLVGIHLFSDTGVEIGAIVFNPIFNRIDEDHPDQFYYKIEHLLDSKCQETEVKDYFVNPKDEDKPTVHDSAEIRLTLAGQKSWLRIVFNSHENIIFADFKDKAIYASSN